MNFVIFLTVMLEIGAAQLIVWVSFFHVSKIYAVNTIEIVIWAALPITWKFLIIHVCSLCSNEAKKLYVLMDRQLNTCSNELVFQKVSALITKMRFRQIEFNTGLFNIGWTMILPIFSTITTYIIIIIQLSGPKT